MRVTDTSNGGLRGRGQTNGVVPLTRGVSWTEGLKVRVQYEQEAKRCVILEGNND